MSLLRRLSIPLMVLALAATAGCKKDKSDVYYGDDAAFEGMGGDGIDSAAVLSAGAGHDPQEPEVFDAGWVGMEAYEVLASARRGDLTYSQVRMSNGQFCTVFHQPDRMVRRVIIGSGRASEATQEVTFAAAGNMVLWFRSDRKTPATLDWAYFHRNSTLALYQVKIPGAQRANREAPAGFAGQIYSSVGDCLSRFGAPNPTPGTYSGPAVAAPQPQLQQPQPVAAPQPVPQPAPQAAPQAAPQRSYPGGAPVRITFRNDRQVAVQMLWLDYNGNEKSYGVLQPGQLFPVDTYVQHAWRFRDVGGTAQSWYVPVATNPTTVGVR